MKRPLLNFVFAAVLALSALLGVVSPASAAHVQPGAALPGNSATTQDAEQVQDDGATSFDTAAAAATGERWIEVDLAQRRLIAHEGNSIFLTTIVSIGKASTPTVKGTFRIYTKLRATRMSGPGYNLPNVPHTMYFYRGYAIHGAYWVKTFGGRVSHGCVNVNLTDAATLFNWASVGTRVWIH
jgi:lipoprotein-anchoring transpeptidase ErfK/SrfK